MYPEVEEQTDRKSTPLLVLLSRFCAGFDTRSPSSGSECDPTLQQGGGILTLVLLLSLGLWALIWGAVSLLAAYEMR